jgi:hypothetical protein
MMTSRANPLRCSLSLEFDEPNGECVDSSGDQVFTAGTPCRRQIIGVRPTVLRKPNTELHADGSYSPVRSTQRPEATRQFRQVS